MDEPMVNVKNVDSNVDLTPPEEHTAEELVAWRNQVTSSSIEGKFVVIDGLIKFETIEDVVDVLPPPEATEASSPSPMLVEFTDQA